jgi:predicted CXXCH cytochrome family protein
VRKRSIFHDAMKLLGTASLFSAALLVGQPAVAQVVTSKHDLTSATGTGGYKTANTAEVCVFCHTPHGSSTAAPLWNKGASGGTFTLYSSATLDSTLLSVGSISLACLSCHDGASGLDNMINAPGSGNYNAAGVSQGYTWATGSNTIGAGITQIGTDLTNDHPVGAAYCAGFTAAGVCKDPDFKLTALNRNAAGTITTGSGAAVTGGALTDQYWVDNAGVGTSGVREKTDIILYTRAFTTPAGNFPSVECGSCHDPHNTGNGTFLRMSNAASALCTTCHNK